MIDDGIGLRKFWKRFTKEAGEGVADDAAGHRRFCQPTHVDINVRGLGVHIPVIQKQGIIRQLLVDFFLSFRCISKSTLTIENGYNGSAKVSA